MKNYSKRVEVIAKVLVENFDENIIIRIVQVDIEIKSLRSYQTDLSKGLQIIWVQEALEIAEKAKMLEIVIENMKKYIHTGQHEYIDSLLSGSTGSEKTSDTMNIFEKIEKILAKKDDKDATQNAEKNFLKLTKEIQKLYEATKDKEIGKICVAFITLTANIEYDVFEEDEGKAAAQEIIEKIKKEVQRLKEIEEKVIGLADKYEKEKTLTEELEEIIKKGDSVKHEDYMQLVKKLTENAKEKNLGEGFFRSIKEKIQNPLDEFKGIDGKNLKTLTNSANINQALEAAIQKIEEKKENNDAF